MDDQILNLHTGEIVEVLSESQIRATLDHDGTLEGVPFMSEMIKFCGKRLRVYRRAEKVCVDSGFFSIRRMRNAVSLEGAICDGSMHDGCTRMCRIFWKEAWLKRAPSIEPHQMATASQEAYVPSAPMSIDRARNYFCQSTNLMKSTEFSSSADFRQWMRDVTSGNFTVLQVAKALYIMIYNKIKAMAGGTEFGGIVGSAVSTPVISLNLQPGDLVEVKTRDEIATTVDSMGRNKGLTIDHEMLRHAGRRFLVLRKVDRIILESNGKMREIQNTVLLKDVTCEGLCRKACSRASYPMWREAWLKKVE